MITEEDGVDAAAVEGDDRSVLEREDEHLPPLDALRSEEAEIDGVICMMGNHASKCR